MVGGRSTRGITFKRKYESLNLCACLNALEKPLASIQGSLKVAKEMKLIAKGNFRTCALPVRQVIIITKTSLESDWLMSAVT